MKYLIIAVIFIFYQSATGQSTNKLDSNNGFKKFKFGMSPSQFSNITLSTLTKGKLKNVKEYVYNGTDISELYGVRVESLGLSFYKDKLYQITVNFGSVYREYTSSEEFAILYSLKAVYGTITHDCRGTEPNDLSVLNCTIWDGRNVRLEHLRIDFESPKKNNNSRTNSIIGYLLFTNKKLQQEQQNSEIED